MNTSEQSRQEILALLQEHLEDYNCHLPDNHFLQTLQESKKIFLKTLDDITRDQQKFFKRINILPISQTTKNSFLRFTGRHFQKRRERAARQEQFVRTAYETLNDYYKIIKLVNELLK